MREPHVGAKPSMVVIDERFWSKGLFLQGDTVRVPLSWFEAAKPKDRRIKMPSHLLRTERVGDLLQHQNDGGITWETVAALEMHDLDLTPIIASEWQKLPDLDPYPGMTERAIEKFKAKHAWEIKRVKCGRAIIKVLAALRDMRQRNAQPKRLGAVMRTFSTIFAYTINTMAMGISQKRAARTFPLRTGIR